MTKRILDSKLLYIILSIVLSVSLWYYVTTSEGVTDTDTVHNIPITLQGEDVLLSNGLMITSKLPDVDIKFQATAATLVKLKQEGTVTLSMDVSNISQPGAYTMAYDIAYTGVSKNNFSMVEQSPVNVSFVVERYVTEEIEIRGQFDGQLAEGYMIRLENNQPIFEFNPKTLTVSGKKSDVDRIAYALVTVEDENLSQTIRGEFTYQLIGTKGEVLDAVALDIQCASETIETVLPVQMFAEIPLTVDFQNGGGATLENNLTWDIEPKSITIAGDAVDMEALLARGKLSVGTIDLATIENDITVLTQAIPLAAELSNVDGVKDVTIILTLRGLISVPLQVTEFDIQNVPEGYQATIQTKSLNVIVRGTEEELARVSPSNLRVVADLSNINLASGQYTVNAKIYFDGIGNAGVIEKDYPLTVRLTKK